MHNNIALCRISHQKGEMRRIQTICSLTNMPTFISQSRAQRQRPWCINYLLIYCNYETESKGASEREIVLLLQKDEPCPLFLSRRLCSVICCRDDSTHCWLDMEADPAHHTRIIRKKRLRLTVLTHLINIIIMCCLAVWLWSFYQEIHLILFLQHSFFMLVWK